jgi:hypothetical protein
MHELSLAGMYAGASQCDVNFFRYPGLELETFLGTRSGAVQQKFGPWAPMQLCYPALTASVCCSLPKYQSKAHPAIFLPETTKYWDRLLKRSCGIYVVPFLQ